MTKSARLRITSQTGRRTVRHCRVEADGENDLEDENIQSMGLNERLYSMSATVASLLTPQGIGKQLNEQRKHGGGTATAETGCAEFAL